MDPVTTYLHLFNQRFQPQFLEGENKELFASYLKTWADLGIYHIQFNVVDKATLLDAQAHPEKYPNLIVRVAGYSAYFVDLGKKWQEEIIRRTEQSFGCC
jgi:formate C-acetyltransferase